MPGRNYLITVSAAMLVFAVLCYLQVDWLFDFVHTAVWVLFYLCATAFLLAGLIRSLLKKRNGRVRNRAEFVIQERR